MSAVATHLHLFFGTSSNNLGLLLIGMQEGSAKSNTTQLVPGSLKAIEEAEEMDSVPATIGAKVVPYAAIAMMTIPSRRPFGLQSSTVRMVGEGIGRG